MDHEANVTLELAALGRPFSLGMLYDRRRDVLIPGVTLWDCNDLGKHIRGTAQPNTEFEIVASESIEDKSSALSVEASLKASFLGGLVNVGGAAKYLNDQKTSRNQARVTLHYKTTTQFCQLSMSHLGRGNMKHQNVFDSGEATHVVTAILYGAQAFFVFDRQVSEQEKHQDVQGNLQMTIKKIPLIAIEGEGFVHLEEEERANVQNFSCKFHGDFSLPTSPVSFHDAMQVYQSLPQLLGPNWEKAVPIKVWLLPLSSLDSTAAKVVRQISTGLVQDSQGVLEDFAELEMRCNDAMRSNTVQMFPQIGQKLKIFKERCSEFKLEFQKTLARKLPSIRGGGEEEAALADILRKRNSSPFSNASLNQWMERKEEEITRVRSFTNLMRNTKIVASRGGVDEEVLRAENAVCFVFTSLGAPEPFLSALLGYLRGESTADNPPDEGQEQWHRAKEVSDMMRNKVKLFRDFAEANEGNGDLRFLAAGLTYETHQGATILLYNDGFLVSEDFEPPSKPEPLTVAEVCHSSVTLKVSPPRFGVENVTSYLVEYRVSQEDEWQQQTVEKSKPVTVCGLTANTQYVFRCRAVTSAGVGPAAECVCTTTRRVSSLAESLTHTSRRVRSGLLCVYQLPLKDEDSNIAGCRRFTFGNDSPKPNRTILLVGVTGAGKSTLIDGMINYSLGVDWNDSFRFKLVVEASTSQAHSQTSEVTVYKINHQPGFAIDHSLTIVDTPGFGDTRGIKRDREITEKLRNLFTSLRGFSEIDAVCFVVQAALARLTASQKLGFDAVLSIFGKDVAENIRVLVTFADGQRPPVLAAIDESGVPCPKTKDGQPQHFKFNNSALFAANKSSAADSQEEEDEDGGFDEMFWKMGVKSMKRFFDALKVIQTKSLTLTKEVLRERQQLENLVENVEKQVQVGLAKLEEIKETSEKLKDHEAEIRRNENFQFEVKVIKPFQVDISVSGHYIMNCQQCHHTCHNPCSRSNDEDKRKCSAMGDDGNCTVCPGRCRWNVHFAQKYKWEYKEVTEKVTKRDLQEKYMKAKGEKNTVEGLMGGLMRQYDAVQKEVKQLIERSSRSLNRLKEIALKPNPLSSPDFIDLLIEGEKCEAKPGWKERVQSLETIREKAEVLAKVERGAPLL